LPRFSTVAGRTAVVDWPAPRNIASAPKTSQVAATGTRFNGEALAVAAPGGQSRLREEVSRYVPTFPLIPRPLSTTAAAPQRQCKFGEVGPRSSAEPGAVAPRAVQRACRQHLHHLQPPQLPLPAPEARASFTTTQTRLTHRLSPTTKPARPYRSPPSLADEGSVSSPIRRLHRSTVFPRVPGPADESSPCARPAQQAKARLQPAPQPATTTPPRAIAAMEQTKALNALEVRPLLP